MVTHCGCGCNHGKKPIVYECDCGEECKCSPLEFTEEPETTPTCCGKPMKRVE